MAVRSEPRFYHPSEGDTLVPGVAPIHEFFGFLADCGQAASEVIYSWGTGQPVSGDHINAVVRAMQQKGLAGGGGLSSLSGNSAQLASEGIPNAVTSDWISAITGNAGSKPVELFVTNARALPGDETNLHNHFLTIVGRTASGDFIASDPDSTQAKNGQFSVFSATQLQAANPQGAIVPSGGGATDPGSSFWQGFWQGFWPGLLGTSGQAQAPQQAAQVAAGLTSDALWRGGLIVLGGLLLLVGVIVFILPRPKRAAQAAQVIGATA
jgi:hypothetical protein